MSMPPDLCVSETGPFVSPDSCVSKKVVSKEISFKHLSHVSVSNSCVSNKLLATGNI